MPEEALTKVHQGFSYRLDPTPAQRQLLASHTGAARFCHNFLLGLVLANWKENRERKEAGEEVTRESYLGTRQLDLQKLWYARRAESAPWFTDNASSTYNSAAGGTACVYLDPPDRLDQLSQVAQRCLLTVRLP